MSRCPRCQRPVAAARPRCLYCGSPLPGEVETDPREDSAAAVPEASLAAPRGEAPPGRTLLVLDLAGVEASALAEAAGLAALEADQLVRRGGFHLHRILPAAAAGREAERLAACGLPPLRVAEAELGPPLVVTGGSLAADALAGRTDAGTVRLVPDQLLLVVRGPIRREYRAAAQRRRPRTATLAEGYRFHLHRRSDARPLELDPGGFEFDDHAGEPGSSLLRIAVWLDGFARGAPVDSGFRLLPPALGAAEPERGPVAAAALLARAERGGGTAVPELLDNLRQFRFYSAWRGAAERRRAGLQAG